MRKLLKDIRDNNILLEVVDGKLKVFANDPHLHQELLRELKAHKDELLQFLINNDQAGHYDPLAAVIPVSPVQPDYPLTSAQHRLWALSRFGQGSLAYNISGVYILQGELDEAALAWSFDRMIERHEILRTLFRDDQSGEVKQYIAMPDELAFTIYPADFRSKSADDWMLLIKQEFAKSFALDSGPLMRASCCRIEDDKWLFIYVTHHIISDGWSTGIFIKELLLFYNSYVAGASANLSPLRIQYKDYAVWQQRQLKEGALKLHAQYWLKQFEGELPVLQLRGDKPRPAIKTYNGDVINTILGARLSEGITALARQQGCTLFMGLLAAVNVLLHRYTGQGDIIIGSPIAGRDDVDLEDQLGLYVNMLPLRVRFDGRNSYRDLLDHIKQVTLDAYQHQAYPFDELVDALGLGGDRSRDPLFDVGMALQNHERYNFGQRQETGRLNICPYEGKEALVCKFDLIFTFEESRDGLLLKIEFNTDIYNRNSIVRLASHFTQLLEAILQHPSEPVGLLEYLSGEEKSQLLSAFNDTRLDYPADKSIVDVFAEQAGNTPDRTAVVFGESSLTYRELDERSDQLAAYLGRNYRILQDDRIGIMVDRSEKMIIAILAILKSGAAYIPIDPGYPKARKEFIIADTGIKVLITQTDYLFDLENYIGAVFAIDVQLYSMDAAIEFQAAGISPANLAYVMYTSGSTGNPKGVMVDHRNVVRLVKSANYIDLTGEEILLSTGSISFDASTFEYWSMLLNGGKLILCPQTTLLDETRLAEEIRKNKVNTIWFTAGWLNQLVDRDPAIFSGVRTLLAGGDKLSADHINSLKLRYPNLRIINGYGPTENTTFSLTYLVSSIMESIPIGKPISNSTVYILDPWARLLPVGVAGEICVGGDGLARGYLNNPELTAEKFVPSPFGEGSVMYRTGDLGRWLPDGNIEYLGRIDDQVKIRGYRVEPAEVGHLLQTHPDIDQAVVLALCRPDGEKELTAYIVGKKITDTSDILRYASGLLPDYMVPAHFVWLDTLPLTPNGKIDMRKLPDPEGEGLSTGVPYIAPRNRIEERLASIWQLVLGKKQVGVRDDFFLLGGHSLKATRLASQIYKEFEVKLDFNDLFTRTVLEDQAALIGEQAKTSFSGILPAEKQPHYPLSSSQRRLWVLSQFREGNIAYNMPGVYVLEGRLDEEALEYAFNALIARHEIIRTVFREDEQGEPRQFICSVEEAGFRVVRKDLRLDDMAANKKAVLDDRIQSAFARPFDLAAGPLLRAELYRVDEQKWVLVYVMHHIISDGWSMGVLIRELLLLYNGRVDGFARPLPAASLQYKDYAVSQQRQLTGAEMEAHKAWWLGQFGGELPVLELPADRPRPAVKTYKGAAVSRQFSPALVKGIKQYSQQQGATLFMSLQAGINALLYRYTGQTDIITGSPIAGREHIDLEEQIGFYVNTLALRTRFAPEDTYGDLLAKVRQVTLEAYRHQAYPFDELVAALDFQGDMSRNALFDVMVVLQNMDKDPARVTQEIGGLQVTYQEMPAVSSKFDLLFDFIEMDGTLRLIIDYSTDIYQRDSIERLADHLERLLKAALHYPQTPVGQLDYLSGEEKQLLLAGFNNTLTDYPHDQTIIDLWEQRVERSPDKIALVFGDRRMTYRELNEKANRLGDYLRKHYQIIPDDLIGIKIERSDWLVIALLGVLKSGAAYVPIDPDYPEERIAHMLQDSACKALIDVQELTSFRDQENTYSSRNPLPVNKHDDLLYTIYTSGSSGKPKGAMVRQGSFVNLTLWYGKLLGLEDKDSILLMAPISFDLAQKNIFTPLLWGARLCLTTGSSGNYEELAETIRKNAVTVVNAAPSAFYPLLDPVVNEGFKKLSSLKKIVLGGEPIAIKEFQPWVRSGLFNGKVINSYGPTECTDVVSAYTVRNDEWDSLRNIPIGTPVDNSRLYILDENRALVPTGVTGELFISGLCLGRGYLRQPELTAEKFVPSPFGEGGLMYRTGDLGRWLPDGNIEYLGRKDDQVKIRGYRIELAEIENVLQQFPGLGPAVVAAKPGPNGDKELVAYITGREDIPAPDIYTHLKRNLPAYMIPGHFIYLESLPLTPSGKVDRRKLPGPEGQGMPMGIAYIAPRNRTEERLAAIWQSVLGKKQVGVRDDFFALGGHSLKATRLASQIYKEFEVKLDFNNLFTRTILEDQAALIDELEKTSFSGISPVEQQLHYPLSSSQQRLWILSQLGEGNVAYNMPGVYVLEGSLNEEALEDAFQALVERHEIVRTVFKEDEQGELRQFIHSPEGIGFRMAHQDLRPGGKEDLQLIAIGDSRSTINCDSRSTTNGALPSKENKKAELDSLVQSAFIRPFDLAAGPLLRAELYRVEEEKWIFVYVMHHIISDGWSMGVLIRELLWLYNARIGGMNECLSPLRIQYKDYASRQQEQLEGAEMQLHKAWWLDQFGGELSVLELPGDSPRPAVKTYKGDSISRRLSSDLVKGIKEYSQQQGATLFMGLLAAVNAILYRYTGQTDITIGSPIAGREHIDLENQIGFYVNTLALRTQFRTEDTYADLLAKIRQTTLEAYRHQAYPFDELVAALDLQRDMSRNPLFDVMLVLQNVDKDPARVEQNTRKLQVSIYEEVRQVTSQFDLLFDFVEMDGALQLRVDYNTDIYNRQTIDRLADHLERLLHAAIQQPGTPVGQLDYLSGEEKQQLLAGFNDTAVDRPADDTVIGLLEQQVKRTPDSVALVFRDRQLTYQELNDRCNGLARYMQVKTGIKKGACVAVLLDRSEWSAISMIAIMKQACVYVPIDTAFPDSRIRHILEQCQPELLITDRPGIKEWPNAPKNLIFPHPDLLSAEAWAPDPNLDISGTDPSFIIYTSGSTGDPKGVEQTHQTLYNLILWDIHGAKMKQQARHLQFSSYSFDSSLHDIYYALATGGEVHIIDELLRRDPWALKDYILEKGISTLSMPYAALKSMFNGIPPEQFRNHRIQEIISTGEQLYITGGLRQFLQSNPSVWVHNLYGPSETHVVTGISYSAVEGDMPEKASIGKPIDNTVIYILDREMQPVPIGVRGEIFIGGANLAIGYKGDPVRTRKKFIEDPFRKGQLIYRSGDIGKWLEDGKIEYITRTDTQVKINGYRIELGEIEAALRGIDKIEEAIVLAKESDAGEKTLVAYLYSKEELLMNDIRSRLGLLLPAYMIPGHFILLENIPLTPNGKVNIRALPDLEAAELTTGIEYVAPRNETEAILVDIWSDILKIDKQKIGVKNNFFELGGHSLKAIRLVSRVYKEFEVRVALSDIFTEPTIERMATELGILLWVKKSGEGERENADTEKLLF